MKRSMMIILFFCFLSGIAFSQTPTPLPVDANTIALWNFDSDPDEEDNSLVVDSGPNNLQGVAIETYILPISDLETTFQQARIFKDQRSYILFGELGPNHPLDIDSLPEWSFEFVVKLMDSGAGSRIVFENGRTSIQLEDRRVAVLRTRNGFTKGVMTEKRLNVQSSHRVAIVSVNDEVVIKVDGKTWASSKIEFKKQHKTSDKNYGQIIRVGGTPRDEIESFKAGKFHGCLTNVIGDLQCWGNNGQGQLGIGVGGGSYLVPVKVHAMKNVSSIALGDFFTCAASEGKTYCWGGNLNNAMGLPTVLGSRLPLVVDALAGATYLEGGGSHSCAVMADSSLKCWGANDQGQLGLGFTSPNSLPATLPGMTNITQLALGRTHSCALSGEGEVYCWGWNSNGQIGQPTTVTSSSIPQVINGLPAPAVKIEAGDRHTCALLSNNQVWCWGSNQFAQLGNGSLVDSAEPTMVSNIGVGEITDITSGNGDHTCLEVRYDEIQADMKCWGRNNRGQFNNPDFNFLATTPVKVTLFGQIQSISAGGSHICYQNNTNVVFCLGDNSFGQLGTGELNAFNFVPRIVLSTRLGFIEGHLDDIRVSNIARFQPVTPEISLIAPIGTSSHEFPQFSFSIASSIAIDPQTIITKLNDTLVTGLNLNGFSLSGVLSSPLLLGENRIEISFEDVEGNQGHFVGVVKYSGETNPELPVKVASSGINTCYVTGEGYLWCWGSNNFGQLGLETIRYSSTPVKNKYLKNIVDVAVANGSICAINRDAEVFCWGDNSVGQLGTEEYEIRRRSSPGKVNISGVSKLVAGFNVFCAVKADGKLFCWGSNPAQLLGNQAYEFVPTQYPQFSDVKDVAISPSHACFIRADDSLWCSGNNLFGQLGDGTQNNSSLAVQVQGISQVSSVGVSRTHTCATTETSGSYCWGENFVGQLGGGQPGNPQWSLVPSPVTIVNAQKIFVGDKSNCAVNENDQLVCWGQNVYGELGDGTYVNNPQGFIHTNLSLEEFTLSHSTACGLTTNKEVVCWGLNTIGQAGNANGNFINAPTEVVPHTTIYQNLSSLVAGHANTCMKISGETYCWGNNNQKQIGNGNQNLLELYPVKIKDVQNVLQTGVGFAVICHIQSGGEPFCSGINNYGQAGQPTIIQQVAVPTSVGLTNIVQVESGLDFTCGLKADGTVWCWGNNSVGQLGDGTTDNSHVPKQVAGLAGALEISAAKRGQHACARTNTGAVWCWGLNGSKQFGGPLPFSNQPVLIPEITNAFGLATGANFTCVLNTDRKVTCIGNNSRGQLGIGTFTNNVDFQKVTLDRPAVKIAAGEFHMCVIDDRKDVRCWGNNESGHLGNGRTEHSPFPIRVMKGADELAVGSEHSCVITDQNKLACWGLNGNAQFGNGTTTDSSIPTFSDIKKL